jgi:DNA-nicking Smr family endonuclease
MKVRQLTDVSALNVAKKLHAQTLSEQESAAAITEASQNNFAKLLGPDPRSAKALLKFSAAPDARELSEESALFRSQMGPVRQLVAKAAELKVAHVPPAPDAAQSRADEAHVIDELMELPDDPALLDGAEMISYLADGHSPKLLRKLRRAQFRICAELDLHHMGSVAAKKMMHKWLHAMRAQAQLCLLVIHGKGLRSGENGAVLKSMVDFELRRRKDVIAFCSPPHNLGGAGAALILLRAPV